MKVGIGHRLSRLISLSPYGIGASLFFLPAYFVVAENSASKRAADLNLNVKLVLKEDLLNSNAKNIPREALEFPVSIGPVVPVVELCSIIEDTFNDANEELGMECDVFCLSKGDNTNIDYNLSAITYFKDGDKVWAQAEIMKQEPPKKDSQKLPVTILTGFLGAGKTTLLNYILKEQEQHKFFVIQNEFGEISIDDELTRNSFKDPGVRKEQIISLENGCMCCAVRGDLSSAFKQILEGYISGKYEIEGVLVETTGMADPKPVVATFSKIPGIAEHMRLDCIVTVVGCNTIIKQLAREVEEENSVNEAVEQVVAADRIILNKQDLLSSQDMIEVKNVIRSLNAYARLLPATKARVDLQKIMNVQAFSLEKLALDPSVLEVAEEESAHAHGDGHGEESHEHAHGHARNSHIAHEHERHRHGHGHDEHAHGHEDHGHTHGEDVPFLHESGISSVGFKVSGEVDIAKFQAFLATLKPEEIYRSKGIMKIKDDMRKFVFHAVHDIVDNEFSDYLWEEEDAPYVNKIVFIGRNLDRKELKKGFLSCIESQSEM